MPPPFSFFVFSVISHAGFSRLSFVLCASVPFLCLSPLSGEGTNKGKGNNMFSTQYTNEKTGKDNARPDRYDKAAEILQNSHDGDYLQPFELWIVQEALNNHLNADGWSKFDEIYAGYVLGIPS